MCLKTLRTALVDADIPNVDTTASYGHMTFHAQLKTRVMKCFVFIATSVKICRLLFCNYAWN